jgi:hypothetical protein
MRPLYDTKLDFLYKFLYSKVRKTDSYDYTHILNKLAERADDLPTETRSFVTVSLKVKSLPGMHDVNLIFFRKLSPFLIHLSPTTEL